MLRTENGQPEFLGKRPKRPLARDRGLDCGTRSLDEGVCLDKILGVVSKLGGHWVLCGKSGRCREGSCTHGGKRMQTGCGRCVTPPYKCMTERTISASGERISTYQATTRDQRQMSTVPGWLDFGRAGDCLGWLVRPFLFADRALTGIGFPQ